jgi:hypothetical protein
VNDFSNKATPVDFSLEAFEETMRVLLQPCDVPRPQLIVSPEVKAQIEADPYLQKAVSYITGSCFDPPQ